MTPLFSRFEQGIDRVAGQLPGMPRDRVILNRLFFFVFNALDEDYDRRLQPHGLNSASFLALAMLFGRPDNQLNPGELSEALIASRTNITRLGDELVRDGWVVRSASDTDRRKVVLSLTASGRERFLQLLPEMWGHIEQQWRDFTPEEIATFTRLLRKMQASLTFSGEPA